MTWLYILLAVIMVLGAVFLLRPRGKKLSAQDKQELLRHWDRVRSQQDPHRRVLDADAVIAQLLGKLGYQGSMADKLKRAAKQVPDLNAVWAAHKLRNRIAHEPGAAVADAEADRAVRALEKVLRKFC
jgi:hypothetical protein